MPKSRTFARQVRVGELNYILRAKSTASNVTGEIVCSGNCGTRLCVPSFPPVLRADANEFFIAKLFIFPGRGRVYVLPSAHTTFPPSAAYSVDPPKFAVHFSTVRNHNFPRLKIIRFNV